MVSSPQACALVTGGARGIGRAITMRLAGTAPVVVVGRTAGDLDRTVAEVAALGGRVACCAGDIADPNTATRALAAAHQQGWWCRHVVCNAGIGKSGATDTFDPAVWRQVMDVNVNGSFWLIQACLPEMLQCGDGVITIMSSLAGVRGVAFDAAYTASKHALVGLARALAAEYAKRGILATALCPSFIEGEMTERTIHGVMARRGLSEEEARRRIAEKTPAKRILSAEEIAEAVALLDARDLTQAMQLAQAGGYPIISCPDTLEMKEKTP